MKTINVSNIFASVNSVVSYALNALALVAAPVAFVAIAA